MQIRLNKSEFKGSAKAASNLTQQTVSQQIIQNLSPRFNYDSFPSYQQQQRASRGYTAELELLGFAQHEHQSY